MTPPPRHEAGVRVVVWNVRSLRDGGREVAARLRVLGADLVVLQEAPRLLGWRTSRRLLARRSGLRLLTRARGCGNLLLAAPGVAMLDAGEVRLPRHPGLHRRAAVWARVVVRGTEVVLAGTHLDLEPAARLDSARRVRAGLPPGPLVLGADVNEEPDGPAWQALATGLGGGSPAPTFPARAPRRRLDALLTSLPVGDLAVVPTGPASDHLALRAVLHPD